MNRGDGQSMGSLGRNISQITGNPANGAAVATNNCVTAQHQG